MATNNNTITAMFDKMSKDATKRKAGDLPSFEDDIDEPSPPKKHRLSIERIYQKKSQLEHILLRPDTYIGSVEKTKEPMWVYDEASESMVAKEITFVPGLYKIFDEILVNAADNKQRDAQGMTTIKINIDPEKNMIMIWNNGKGIPVVEHATEKVYVPTLIFGHLLTSSNYNDDEKKVTGGRNGYGAKLCNIFSTKFVVETRCSDYGLSFKQTWTDNMTKAGEPKVTSSKGEDFTSITFWPDLKKFNMDSLDNDIVDLFKRRAYDMVASTRGVKVYLNGKKLEIKNFKDYVELFTKGKVDDLDQPLKVVFETVNNRWEVGVALSNQGFQQVSFVNSIATTKGGKHVDFVTDQIVATLIEVIKKKEKKAGIPIKPNQVKTHMWVFINCLIENPTFDSQTKEYMTKQAKSFGSTCQLSEKFFNSVTKSGVVDAIQSWMRIKQQAQLNQKSGTKRQKLKGIPKLDDANDAGTKNSIDCTLILTEGDSAKTLAVAGLGVVGRDRYGVFPLKGKVLNVRDALHKQLMDNAEINNLVKIVGLQYKLKYDTPESLNTLRYGKVMIMTDQDQDGSHIKGLIINFIHSNWPHLLKHKFLEEFITPIVKVSKKQQEKSFYSLPEFEEWKSATENWHTWKVKYYKGLGTSTAKEAKEYFRDMARHRIPFKYAGPEDDAAIVLAFSKQKIQERKEWLTNWMEEKKRRAEIGLQEAYLYGKDTKFISYNEFVNKELILYSNMDNERSIPSIMDGFKPGQRKVIFTCLKRNLIKEIKVAQLAGSVAELSAYHHGENSLMATIIGLAQNFVGSNNLNLLLPIGQFGTRLNGGKDCASPRYIFTALSSLTRHVFNASDDPLLKCMTDDNLKIEPEWYVPIIPMVLVNGAEGIGTGWSTKIPNYDIREIVNNIRMMLDGREPLPMIPSFKHFKGEIEMIDNTKCVSNGEISILDEQTIEITELPVRVWTQVYKEQVLEQMLLGTEKIASTILDYKEYHTDLTVRFLVKMSPETMRKAREQGMHRFFKLQTTFPTTSMVLFDAAGCIRRYENVESILKEFYELRLEFYRRRKDYLEGMLAAESLKLDNQARFIVEKIDKLIIIENVPKKEIIRVMLERKYDSDPVKAWKKVQAKLQSSGDSKSDTEEGDEESGGPDYAYILSMQLLSLSREKKEELLKQKQQKADELYHLRKKSPTDLWRDDLDAFVEELDKVEKQEKEDELLSLSHPSGKPVKGKGSKKALDMESRPSPKGVRVVPSTEALRSKIEAVKVAAGRRKKKTEDAVVDGDGDKLMAESLERSNSEPSKPQKAKRVTKPREKKEQNSTPKKKGARKGNKKIISSDEDSDGGDISMEFSGGDSDEDFGKEDSSFENLAVHKKPRKKVINSFDEGDEDNLCCDGKQEIHDGEEIVLSDDGDFKPSAPKQAKPAKTKQVTDKKKVVAKKPTEKKPKEPSKPKATKAGVSKAAKSSSKKKAISDSEEEHDSQNKGDDFEEEEVHVPLRERLARRNKQITYNYGEDSEED